MLDKQHRILIPKEFMEINSDRRVYFYYSVEEKLFYILPEENEKAFLIAIRNSDNERRVIVPKEILRKYESKDILLAKKGVRLYLIPN